MSLRGGFDEEILVAASALVESLTPQQRRRMANEVTYFVKVPTRNVRKLMEAVDALNDAIDEEAT